MNGVVHDKRFSGKPAGITSYLVPGCGFGGSCFPKDVKALRQFAYAKGYTPKLIKGIMEVNESQIDETIKKLKQLPIWIF